MATLLVKRGLQANIEQLTLSAGEPAFATDTGNFYIGTTGGKKQINPKIGAGVGDIVTVGADGKIPDGLMPSIAICDIFDAANETAMLALTAQKGDICIRTDEGKSYVLSAAPATAAANWKWLKTPDCKLSSVNGKTGAVVLTAAEVGAEALLKDAAAKIIPVDADTLPLSDSAAESATKKITFSNIKAALKTYFDTFYNKYVHPAYTAKTAGLYKVTVDEIGHVSAATAVAKGDITALGIPAQDTVYTLPTASTSVLGGAKIGAGLSMTGDVLSVGSIDGGTF